MCIPTMFVSGERVRAGPVLGAALLLPGLRLLEVVLPLPLRTLRLRLHQHQRSAQRLRAQHATGTSCRSRYVLLWPVLVRLDGAED